jgi:hypothetical protein
MPAVVTLVSTPRLRKSNEKAMRCLSKFAYETLFLNFSRELEEYVQLLAEGLPYSHIMAEIRRSQLIPEAIIGSWEYYAEPILRSIGTLKNMRPNLSLYCYGTPSYEHLSAQLSVKIALQTFRSMTTGKIDVKTWRKLLEEDVKIAQEASEDEAEWISSRILKYNVCTCLSEVSNQTFSEKLKERGIKLKVLMVEPEYHPTPIEKLKNEISKGKISDERIIQLIKEHVNYVKHYVLPSRNLDEAYEKWKKRNKTEKLV